VITYEITIVCDACGEMFSIGQQPSPALTPIINARSKGWTIEVTELCPECSEINRSVVERGRKAA
jgi:hypothetical protein